MGKKNKNKHKHKANNSCLSSYNKKQFADIICSQCTLCLNYNKASHDPSFCFKIFSKDRFDFLNHILVNLRSHTFLNFTSTEKQLEILNKSFCGHCKLFVPNSHGILCCENIMDCLDAFTKQVNPVVADGRDLKTNCFKKKELAKFKNNSKPKEKFIVEPSPSFICTKNQDWINLIASIQEEIINEDNNTKQNNSRKPSTKVKGTTS